MSIPIAKRVPKPANMGFPCSICIRIERLRQIVSKGQIYLDKRFTEKDKRDFWRSCSKEVVKEARKRYETLSKKDKKSVKLRNLILSRLNSLWKQEKALRQKDCLMAQRLEKLKRQMSLLMKEHPKCAACGICFGEKHMETPHPSPIGDLCSFCYESYIRQGHDAFVRRLPQKDKEEEEEEALD